MSARGNFEEISAGAISPQMPPCKGIIINVGSNPEIIQALKELYSSTNSKIYIVTVTAAKLKATLEKCSAVGVPAIVNCAEELPAANVWHPGREYSATLVSAGSYDIAQHDTTEESTGYCRNIISHILSDNHVSSFSSIGYQSYMYDPRILHELHSHYFEDMRLGVLRDNITLCEPLVRDAEYAFIDMRAVRYSDYPSSNNSNPNGLYAEEICTIARYIGLGCNLKAVFIFGTARSKQLTVCYKLIAQTIWHLCGGIESNIPESPTNEKLEDYFSRKIVSMGDNGENITFATSGTTKRWWMEIPVNENNIKYVPCSIEDYKTACSGEVPLKWLFFYQKHTLK